MSVSTILPEVEYPESDGQPMGETDVHRAWMIRIYDLLKYRYRNDRVYVGSDLLLYYVEGVPRKYIVPDDFVVLDSNPDYRRVFKTWEERRVPNVVFEVTSKYTRREDEQFKPKTYAEIGVKELFLYDPTSDYLNPPLQGFRLEAAGQVRIVEDAAGALECRELGLVLRLKGRRLILEDRSTGQPLLTEAESERAKRKIARANTKKARAAAEEAQAAAEAAEARARSLEEELNRLRAQLGQQRPGPS